MNNEDKLDLIAAILASGAAASKDVATPQSTVKRFRAIRERLRVEGIDGAHAVQEPPQGARPAADLGTRVRRPDDPYLD